MSFTNVVSQTKNSSTNPIENMIDSLNTNPYFIGSMMLLLNLGGRHLSGGLTPEQDKFLQHPLFRSLLFFIVFFVATRNLLTSFWMALLIVLCINFLFNEHSSLYLFNLTVPKKKSPPVENRDASGNGLTPEELEIHRKLSEKIERFKQAYVKPPPVDENKVLSEITDAYTQVMSKF